MCIFTDHVFSYPYGRREDVSGINNKTIVSLTRKVFWKFLLPPEFFVEKESALVTLTFDLMTPKSIEIIWGP